MDKFNSKDIEVNDIIRLSFLYRGQLIVENEGSTTRDYLAFERNFLSWTKLVATSMVISGALIIRLQINEVSKDQSPSSFEDRYAIPVGIIFFVISILSIFASTSSFFRTQRDMLKGLGHLTSGHFAEFTNIFVALVLAASCVLLLISTEHTSTS